MYFYVCYVFFPPPLLSCLPSVLPLSLSLPWTTLLMQGFLPMSQRSDAKPPKGCTTLPQMACYISAIWSICWRDFVILDSSSVRFSVNLPLCAFLMSGKGKNLWIPGIQGFIIFQNSLSAVGLICYLMFQPYHKGHVQCKVPQKMKEISILL